MLSAIILAFDPAPQAALERADAGRREAIVRTLTSLVDACVAGLVADAVLIGPPDSGLGAIADEAGCGLIEAVDARSGLTRALPGLRHPDVLVLTRLALWLAEPVGLIARREDFGAAGNVATLARRLRAGELRTRARRAI
jgi:hypothetical protein